MLQSKIFDIVRLVIFALLQVLIMNNIDFFGYADPYIYMLFILLLPLDRDKYLVLVYAFLLGLLVDLFENTGGVNAFVLVFITFMRGGLVKFLQPEAIQQEEKLSLSKFSFLQWTIYLVILIFAHHFLLDWIQVFSLDQWENLLERSALGASLTLLICILYMGVFPVGRNQEI